MADKYAGSRAQIMLIEESTRGTLESIVAGSAIPHDGTDFDQKVTTEVIRSAKGRIEDNMDHAVVHKHSEGVVPMQLLKSKLHVLMQLVFGNVPTPTGPVGDIYTRTYTLTNDNNHKSHSVLFYEPKNGIKGYANGMLDELTLEFPKDASAKASMKLIAGKEESSSGTPSYDTNYVNDVFVPDHLTVEIADDVASLTGTGNVDVSNHTIVVSKNAGIVWTNQEAPADIVNQRFGIGGVIEVPYENTTLRDYVQNGDTKAMRVTIDDGSDTVITITFGAVGFMDHTRGSDNDAFATMSVNWFAKLDDSDAYVSATVESKVS